MAIIHPNRPVLAPSAYLPTSAARNSTAWERWQGARQQKQLHLPGAPLYCSRCCCAMVLKSPCPLHYPVFSKVLLAPQGKPTQPNPTLPSWGCKVGEQSAVRDGRCSLLRYCWAISIPNATGQIRHSHSSKTQLQYGCLQLLHRGQQTEGPSCLRMRNTNPATGWKKQTNKARMRNLKEIGSNQLGKNI